MPTSVNICAMYTSPVMNNCRPDTDQPGNSWGNCIFGVGKVCLHAQYFIQFDTHTMAVSEKHVESAARKAQGAKVPDKCSIYVLGTTRI